MLTIAQGVARRSLVLLVVGVVVSGCSFLAPVDVPEQRDPGPVVDAEPPAEPRPLKTTLQWRRCGQRFRCAQLPVPVDYAKPDGPKLKLALIKLPAPRGADRLGSLILNPGGPGGSGVDFVRSSSVETIPAELRARFDVVGFDPRGVARSQPVSCGEESQRFLALDLAPETPESVRGILAGASTLAEACEAHAGNLLRHVATTAVARDLDRIRRAVGDRTLTYVGYSYGTFIGMTYADMFPDRVRALVLDGPVDPALDGLQRARDQAAVLEKTLGDFFRECRKDRACHQARLSLESFEDLLARLRTSPMPAPRLGAGRALHAAEALYATALLLKDSGLGWTVLGAALSAAGQGDGSLLLAVAEGGTGQQAASDDHQFLAALLAVNCLDVPVPRPDAYPSAATDLADQSPHFGGLMLLLGSPCAYWPVRPQREATPIRAEGSPTLLVIGTTNDPTTPYHWATAVAKQLSNARLFTRTAESHTAFGGRNVCTDRIVIDYLIHGILPPEGQECG